MGLWKDRAKTLGLLAVIGGGGWLVGQAFRGDPHGGEVKPLAERKPLPEIAMKDLAGATWRLSDHKGKVVLVNFWATWCPPCREETPALVRIASEYKSRGVEMAGISLDEQRTDVEAFVRRYEIPYAVLLPPAGHPVVAQIPSLPTTLLVDRAGNVARTYVGAVREATFRKDIDALLSGE